VVFQQFDEDVAILQADEIEQRLLAEIPDLQKVVFLL
jgi:hypothetical protein